MVRKKKSNLKLSIEKGKKKEIKRRPRLKNPLGPVKTDDQIIDDSTEVQELTETKVEFEPPREDAHQPIPIYKVFPDAASSTASLVSLIDGPAFRDTLPPEEEEIERSSSPLSFLPGDEELKPHEVVVDKNGLPRQAGATMPEGEFIKRYKRRAEQNLYIFTKGVLGRFFLTPHFHRDICSFIQKCPPYRKLILMPREHAKTTIVAGGLPPHILVQPAETNIYFPGMEGSDCRILLCGETETMAKKNLRVIQDVFMGNKLFRAFWPHRCWDGKREARIWSSEQIIIPRGNEWPDPTIRAIGVGGAVTGARPNVMIKDDLVSFKAANSDTVMDEAIEWHKASRALLDKYEVESGLSSLEFTIGTRWAVFDLYSYIIDNDPSVEVNDPRFHKIVNDGKILWPEKNTMEDIEQLQREHGSNFYLLYLNSAADPELTDFDINLVRPFTFEGGYIIFEENEDDVRLEKKVNMRKKRLNGEIPAAQVARGTILNQTVMDRMLRGGGGMRFRGV